MPICLHSYVTAVKSEKFSKKPSGRKIIAMSLYGSERRLTLGAIRNAQLVPVLLPDWTLRVYAAKPTPPAAEDDSHWQASNRSTLSASLAVPPYVIETLLRLGAEVASVPTTDDGFVTAARENATGELLLRF